MNKFQALYKKIISEGVSSNKIISESGYNLQIQKFESDDTKNQIKQLKSQLLRGRINTTIYQDTFRFVCFVADGDLWNGWTNWIPGTVPSVEIEKIDGEYHITLKIKVFGHVHKESDDSERDFQGVATWRGVINFEDKLFPITWAKGEEVGAKKDLTIPTLEFTNTNAWEANLPYREWYNNNHPTWVL